MSVAIEARPVWSLHPERCTGCLSCLLACSLEHEGFCSPRWARLRVGEAAEGMAFTIDVCLHCEDAPCLTACATDALFEAGGVVALDRELCTGCRACLDACPAAAVFFDPREGKALKCDLCMGEPRCVAYCETGALELAVPRAVGAAGPEGAIGQPESDTRNEGRAR